MKLLSRHLHHILPKIKKSPRILVFLDYDGTLTPIVDRPYDATLSFKTKKILRRLSEDKRIVLSVVSGRSLNQIKAIVGVRSIYYAGNHGLEIEHGRKSYIIPEARKSLPIIKRLKKDLTKRLKSIPSVEIEDKGVVVAVHYRRVKGSIVPRLKEIFFKTVRPYSRSRRVRIGTGKKVLEIRPSVRWNKGRFCLSLLNRLKRQSIRLLPIYIGDDETDEDAFKMLRKRGITIFVKGDEKKTSCAEYYIDSADDVADFLRLLRKANSHSNL